jgi:hypothetical protein
VYYLEDTNEWTLDLDRQTVTDDSSYALRYISRVMSWFGFQDRWAFRAAAENRRVYGLSESTLAGVLDTADVIINLCGSTQLRDEYLRVPIRLYLETDPGAPEIQVALGDEFATNLLGTHTHHYTYAENLGAADCALPIALFDFRPTRPPVVMDWWKANGSAMNFAVQGSSPGRFTTVASWEQSDRDVEWKGETYTWSKHHQFLKFIDLPSHLNQPLELALACGDPSVISMLKSHGWLVEDAVSLTKDILPYRQYLFSSRGEFTVAKDLNARLRTGWFSDRSATYLAAGKPVITQDTGFGNIFPTGRGLFAFNTVDDVVAAVETINADYAGHCRAAHAIAAEYFQAERVVAEMFAAL